MATAIEVLAGLGGREKTAQLLGDYRAALERSAEALAPGKTLWLAPTRRARQAVLRELAPAKGQACFQPQVYTFDGFAERLLQYSETTIRPLLPAMCRTLLRRIVEAETAAGRLAHFGPIAHTPGFLDLVSSLIAELKREETWPEEFSRAVAVRGGRTGDGELAAIYSAYQDRLLRNNLYDAEGRFWSARTQLAQGNWGRFPPFRLVVVDGFTDFTHTQYEILHLLARRTERMVVTLPLESSPLPLPKGEPEGVALPFPKGESEGVRSELFWKPRRSLELLQKTAATPPQVRTIDPAPDADAPAGLAHVAAHLFANPRRLAKAASADGLDVLAVTGTLGEVRALAARIKRLLLDGVAADEIVVAFRQPQEYVDLIAEVFTAAGIPWACDLGQPLSRAPVIKAVMAVLALEQEDWPFRGLQAVLNSSFFSPPLQGGAGGGDSPASQGAAGGPWPDACRDVARLLRHSQLPGNRRAILNEAHYQAERNRPPDDRRRYNAVAAATLLDSLSAALAPLRSTHDFEGWTRALLAVAHALGIAPASAADSPRHSLEDRTAWERFTALLTAVGALPKLTGQQGPGPTQSLGDFVHELTDLLQHERVPPQTGETGRVRVLDAAQVRGLDVSYLFLGGLGEGSFPARHTDDCLCGELDRQELSAQGVPLNHRQLRLREEMLLFYTVVTRARRRLTLSYPAVAPDGQPLSPSPYLSALIELFQDGVVPQTREEHLDPVPPEGRLLDAADARVAATARALDRQPGWFRTLASGDSAVTMRSILRAADMDVWRFHTRGFTAYEGLLARPRNLQSLALRFPREHEFSATHLEAYAACPFQFWVSRVLKIEPQETPETGEDYARRGSLVHDVLAAVHEQLLAEFPDDANPPPDQFSSRFIELIETKLAEWHPATDAQRGLFEVEARLLSRWGRVYADQWAEYHATLGEGKVTRARPAQLEVYFGTPRPGKESHFPALVLGEGSDETRVAGQIDRIDLACDKEGPVYNVVDYKTGAAPKSRPADMLAGRTLQLVLYALAARRLDIVPADARPHQAGYWSLREAGFVSTVKPEAWDEHWDNVEATVLRLARGIRTGQFPVFNTDNDCTGRCDYAKVCRVGQVRGVGEKLSKVWP